MKWNKISTEKLKTIENKKEFENKIKESIRSKVDLNEVEKTFKNTENDLSKLADQTYSKVQSFLKGKFP